MLTQSKILTALELKNLFGLNTLRHTKDKSVKKKAVLLGVAWVMLIVMVAGYVGGLVYGLSYLGMGSIAPAYLTMISSLIIFAFGIFKTGGVIFNRNGYDILSSLPLKKEAIVVARFARMYIEDLLMTLLVMLSGGAVYAVCTRPAWYFYPTWLISTLLIPLLPLSVATLFGTLVTAISSRMRNKSVVESILSVGFAVAIIALSTSFGSSAESMTPEMLANLAETVTTLIGGIYPPAIWLGNAMAGGNFGALILCAAVYCAVFAAMTALVAHNFHDICRRLSVTSAKHDYRMGQLTSSSVLKAVWLREVKRYFASGIYVTNTIMGPIMGTVMAVAYLIAGTESLNSLLGVEMDFDLWLPFVVAGSFSMMPPTAVSLSMEGKNWWISKTLPLSAKTVMDGKLFMSLSLMLPFYIVSEAMMLIAAKPDFIGIVWTLVIPAAIIVFSCVFGITANILLPKFDWDSEVSIVKQSASAAVGGFGGLLATIAFAAVILLLPDSYADAAKLVGTLAILIATALLYRKNITTDLRKL